MIPAHKVEDAVDKLITGLYGDQPHTEKRLVPGNDGQRRRAEIKRSISVLDPDDTSYDERLAELRTELASIKPEPDKYQIIDTGKTVGERWTELTPLEKKQYLAEHGWMFKALGGKRGTAPEVTLILDDADMFRRSTQAISQI